MAHFEIILRIVITKHLINPSINYFLSGDMKQVAQVNRVNYALSKHHKEQLHQQIDPRIIDQIEFSDNPSYTYKNAFKSVYKDELQKTLEEQREKKQIEKAPHYKLNGPRQFRGSQYHEDQNSHMQSLNHQTYSGFKMPFIDYQEEKQKKREVFIQRGVNEGHSFFRSQDEYQQRRQQQKLAANQILQEQLKLKEHQKYTAFQNYNMENLQVKENVRKQMEFQMLRKEQVKVAREHFGDEIRRQIQFERSKKNHKSYYNLNNVNRHNPVTNPIEYHIDNPYILQKIQQSKGTCEGIFR